MEKQDLQTLWEKLNAALYDIQAGSLSDAAQCIEECIKDLENNGAGA